MLDGDHGGDAARRQHDERGDGCERRRWLLAIARPACVRTCARQRIFLSAF
jgi:hypothetical protein